MSIVSKAFKAPCFSLYETNTRPFLQSNVPLTHATVPNLENMYQTSDFERHLSLTNVMVKYPNLSAWISDGGAKQRES